MYDKDDKLDFEEEYEPVTKIDVEESKRQGRIVTKVIDENDPEYMMYPKRVKGSSDVDMKDADEKTQNISVNLAFYFVVVLFFIPLSFVVFRAFVIGGDKNNIINVLPIYGILLFALGYILFGYRGLVKSPKIGSDVKLLLKAAKNNFIVVFVFSAMVLIVPLFNKEIITVDLVKQILPLYMIIYYIDLVIQYFITWAIYRNDSFREDTKKYILFNIFEFITSTFGMWIYVGILGHFVFEKTLYKAIFYPLVLVIILVIYFINKYLINRRLEKNKLVEATFTDYYVRKLATTFFITFASAALLIILGLAFALWIHDKYE